MAENRSPTLLGNTLAFGITALIFVTWRIAFRVRRRFADASDWCIAIAFISSVVQDVLNIAAVVDWGYGQHSRDLPPRTARSPTPLFLFYLNQIFFKVTTLFTKLSLCLVYLRVFQRANSPLVRWTRVTFYAAALIVVSAYGSSFFICIFECSPISKQWIKAEHGTCVDLDAFRLGTAAINLSTSVLVIATPLPALFLLKKHGSREVSEFIFLILLGVVHTGCTVARLVMMLYPDPSTTSDPQWANNTPNAVAMIEMDVGIIAASLVVMRAHFHAIIDLLRGGPDRKTLPGGSQGSHFGAAGFQGSQRWVGGWSGWKQRGRGRNGSNNWFTGLFTFDPMSDGVNSTSPWGRRHSSGASATAQTGSKKSEGSVEIVATRVADVEMRDV